MISHARQSPAVPGFRVIADFRGLYTIGYTFLVPVYTPYIPGIYKHIDAYLPSFISSEYLSKKATCSSSNPKDIPQAFSTA